MCNVTSFVATRALFGKVFTFACRFLHKCFTDGERDTGKTVLAFASHGVGTAHLSGEYGGTCSAGMPFGMELAIVTERVSAAQPGALACGASRLARAQDIALGKDRRTCWHDRRHPDRSLHADQRITNRGAESR